MMASRIAAALLMLVVLPFGLAGAEDRGSLEQAQAMAEAAAALVRSEGPAAYPAFNTAPEWKDRDLYVFVVGLDGITVAHGAEPARIGTDARQLVDANGVHFGEEFLAVTDHGWVDYTYANPVSGANEAKRSYIIRVGETIVGVGAYKP